MLLDGVGTAAFGHCHFEFHHVPMCAIPCNKLVQFGALTICAEVVLTECNAIVKSTSGSTGYKWTYWILSTDRPTAYVITPSSGEWTSPPQAS